MDNGNSLHEVTTSSEEAAASVLKSEITEDESELYDRQIRLWGLEAQKRLRHSKLLIIGLGGLGAEVTKNIALAGVKSITLLDDKKVTKNDRSSQFLLHDATEGDWRSEMSKPKVCKLNQNVEVLTEMSHVDEKDDEYLKQFNVICATDCSLGTLLRLDKLCSENNIYFFCGDTWGLHGYFFLNLGSEYRFVAHQSKSAARKNDEDEPQKKKQRLDDFTAVKYTSLEHALSMKRGKTGVGLHKKVSKIFFLAHIAFKFREEHKRFPVPEHHEKDIELLKPLRDSVLEQLGFNENSISDDDLKCIFGEMSSVCAIVGGLLAQEIIKAVSANMTPLKNFLLFDGDLCKGVVENIG